jgi:hypothetical protein
MTAAKNSKSLKVLKVLKVLNFWGTGRSGFFSPPFPDHQVARQTGTAAGERGL